MAGGSKSKAGKGRSSKETTKAEEAESSDDEEWVLYTTTPVVLDPVVTHVPVKKTQVQGQVPNLNPLPREKETDEVRGFPNHHTPALRLPIPRLTFISTLSGPHKTHGE